jgi:hypothetical protein
MQKMKLFSIEDSRYIQIEKITNEIKKNYVRFEKGFDYFIEDKWTKTLIQNNEYVLDILKEMEIKHGFKIDTKIVLTEIKHQIYSYLQAEREEKIVKKMEEELEFIFLRDGCYEIKKGDKVQEVALVIDGDGAIKYDILTILKIDQVAIGLLEGIFVKETGKETTVSEMKSFLRESLELLYRQTREYKLKTLYSN